MTAPQFAPGFSHWANVSAARVGSVVKLARTTAQPKKPRAPANNSKSNASEISAPVMVLYRFLLSQKVSGVWPCSTLPTPVIINVSAQTSRMTAVVIGA